MSLPSSDEKRLKFYEENKARQHKTPKAKIAQIYARENITIKEIKVQKT